MTATPSTWRFLAGFAVLYAVLAGLAGIDATGRYGVVILVVVLLVAVPVERALGGPGLRSTLGRPGWRPLGLAGGIALLVQAVYPVVAGLGGATFALVPGWPWALLGVFAFHGLAEELVWRGYAYRRLRAGRSFRAAVLATMPLVAATHVPVIATSGLTVGAAAMLVAAVTSLPLAHLFELGRRTVWAPAVVHAGIDTFKVVDVPTDARLAFSLALAAVSLTVPLLALAVPRPTT